MAPGGCEVKDSFSPVQIDVFHALWGSYHPREKVRSKILPPKEQGDKINREKVLNAFPFITRLGKDFIDRKDGVRTFVGKVISVRALYWQMKYGDGDWEDVGLRKMAKLLEQGRKNEKARSRE